MQQQQFGGGNIGSIIGIFSYNGSCNNSGGCGGVDIGGGGSGSSSSSSKFIQIIL